MKAGVLLSLVAIARAVTVNVPNTGGKAASKQPYGLMFEDISHSGDGGIYAELIQNRALQLGGTTAWSAVGGATLSLTSNNPLTSAIPNSVSVVGGGSGTGLANSGWWGIEVKPQTYNGSFYARGAYTGNFVASLRSSSGQVLASTNITSTSTANTWTKYNFTLTPTTAADNVNNTFALTFDGNATLQFTLISLFPPTWNNRTNGLRKDIMQVLSDMNLGFLRFPGGNNIEGDSNGYWKWENTVGDLSQRPGRQGTWGYFNTDGIGLIEFMLWCQDLRWEPILAVWSGHGLGGQVVNQSAFGPVVQEAMNELEFLMGDASTTYGARRIALGYADPFKINYIEIGNEDNIYGGEPTYNQYRFGAFYSAIHAKYPNMTVMASQTGYTPVGPGTAGDFHEYVSPDGIAGQFNMFDSYPTANPTLVGEYSAKQGAYPQWLGSVGESIMLLGTERNSDKIIGASYAPSLENLNSVSWNPDLIQFNADSKFTTCSTSCETIGLYAQNRFTTVLASGSASPAYWVAGVNRGPTAEYILKAAVYNGTQQAFSVSFPYLSSGQVAQLTVKSCSAGAAASTTPGGASVVQTAVMNVTASGASFSFSLPALSVAVLRWNTGGRRC